MTPAQHNTANHLESEMSKQQWKQEWSYARYRANGKGPGYGTFMAPAAYKALVLRDCRRDPLAVPAALPYARIGGK